jgi:hypothetical protein
MHPSSAGRLEKDVPIGLETGLLEAQWNLETFWPVKVNAGGGIWLLMYWKALQGVVMAHAVRILLYGGDIARTPIDLLVAEEKIAKSVGSNLRTFGDSGVVCLGARLVCKAENFDSRRSIRKAAMTSMLMFVIQFTIGNFPSRKPR